jgi:hypothetical protein
MVNFSAFEQAINALGGVDVNAEEDIYDNRYPGPNFSYQTFSINKGPHHLDGATALKYVRVRHNAGGDFGRARRQQQIIEAARDKFFEKRGLREGLSFFNQALDIVKNNVKTDVDLADYFPFLLLVKDIRADQIVNRVLDNGSGGLLENYNPVMGGLVAYTLRPRAGNYFEIRKLAAYILHLDEMDRQEKARAAEKARVAIYSAPELTAFQSKVANLLKDKGYQIVSIAANLESVYIWQIRAGARMPALSEGNRQSLATESFVDKITVSPSALRQTVVYDNVAGSKIFSLDDLIRRLNGQVSLYQDKNVAADFIVILGNNINQVFQKDEGDFFLTEQGMEQEKAEGEGNEVMR